MSVGKIPETIERLIRLETRAEDDKTSRAEWRAGICKKMDEVRADVKELVGVFAKLPCSKREGWYSSMNRQMIFMWAVLAILLVVSVNGFMDRDDIKKSLSFVKTELMTEKK